MTYFNDNTPADIQDIELAETLGWKFYNEGMLDTVSPERDAIIREEAAMRHFSHQETEALVQRINDGTYLANAMSQEAQQRITNNVMGEIDLMP